MCSYKFWIMTSAQIFGRVTLALNGMGTLPPVVQNPCSCLSGTPVLCEPLRWRKSFFYKSFVAPLSTFDSVNKLDKAEQATEQLK